MSDVPGPPVSEGESATVAHPVSGVGGSGRGSSARVPDEPWRLWDHIGVISGVVLGLVAFGFLVLLAAAGDRGALAVVITLVIGVGFIYLGGQIRAARRR